MKGTTLLSTVKTHQMHTSKQASEMKPPHLSFFPYLLTLQLFSLAWPTSAHPHENFLHCLSSFDSMDAPSTSKLVYTQNDASYSDVLESTIQNLRFSTPATPKPLVIVTPLNASHVQATVHCSRKHGLQIRIRSGGHDYEGLSYVSKVPFIILDLVDLRSVEVDVENKVAWVQSGALLGELHYKIAEQSGTLAFPAGACPTVGVGGFLSGGGFGVLFRKYGLGADNVIDAQLVDVNGRILDRNSMGEDVFWAIRGGGGGSFGIVLAWKVKLVPVPATVTVFTISKTVEQNATQLLDRWQYVAPKLPDDIFSTVIATRVNSGQAGKKTIIVSFISLFLGGVDELIPLMEERFPELGLRKEDCIEMSWIESVLFYGRIYNGSADILLDRSLRTTHISPSFIIKSDYVKEPIPETAFTGIWSKLYEAEAEEIVIGFVAYGGKMAEIPESATPFPHRAGNLYKIIYVAGWEEEDNVRSQEYISWMRDFYSHMTPFVSKSPRAVYIGYRDLDIGINKEGDVDTCYSEAGTWGIGIANKEGNTGYSQASVWGHKYLKDNFDKLVYVKTMIDPQNFFNHEQSIPSLLA